MSAGKVSRLKDAAGCSIGTPDPWHVAGLGLDIRALAECGVRPVTVVAGISAQDARGQHARGTVDPRLISAQFDALAEVPNAAYRVGALLDAAAVEIVAEHIAHVAPRRWSGIHVFGASGGRAFHRRSHDRS